VLCKVVVFRIVTKIILGMKNNLPINCFRMCDECNRLRMIGTICKNPITQECDEDERYFYQEIVYEK